MKFQGQWNFKVMTFSGNNILRYNLKILLVLLKFNLWYNIIVYNI